MNTRSLLSIETDLQGKTTNSLLEESFFPNALWISLPKVLAAYLSDIFAKTYNVNPSAAAKMTHMMKHPTSPACILHLPIHPWQICSGQAPIHIMLCYRQVVVMQFRHGEDFMSDQSLLLHRVTCWTAKLWHQDTCSYTHWGRHLMALNEGHLSKPRVLCW